MISFKVQSNELSAMLQSVARVVPTQDPNRLRTELLFEIRDQQLRITGSNSQFRISGKVELLEAQGNCRFTIPPADIVDYVKDLAEQPLSFTYEPNDELKRGPLKMEFGGGQIRFTATDGENYPEFEEEDGEKESFTIDSHFICDGLTAVLPSVSPDTSRKAVSGVCFRFFGNDGEELPGSLDMVATDTVILSRFSIVDRIFDVNDDRKRIFILPANCANFLKTFLQRYSVEPVKVSFSEKSILFQVGTVEIESLLIDANYPNYKSIIPKNCEYELVADTPALRTIIRRMVKFISNDGIISLSPQGDQLLIRTEKTEENKSAEEKIAIENVNNYTSPIYFDKKRLMTLIDNISTAKIAFRIIDNSRPILIAPYKDVEGGDDDEKQAVKCELINLISAYALPSSY